MIPVALAYYYLAHVPCSLWLWVLHSASRHFPRTSGLLAAIANRWRQSCQFICCRRSRITVNEKQAIVHDKTAEDVDALGMNAASGSLVARDGTRISYQIIYGESSSAPVMLLCNGLGALQFRVFSPIIARFGAQFTYITWDYRGLFGSERPKSVRRLAVSEHAHDAAEVLAACGYDRVDIVIGWSMGVQVGLEFVLLYPEMAQQLVLMNGAHGQVFHSALQPIIRLPIIHDVARAVIGYAAAHPGILRVLRRVAMVLIPTAVRLYVKLLGSRLLKDVKMFGERYVEATFTAFLNHITATEKSMASYLWLFQELNAHSIYHLLGCIEQEALLISGLFDLLLPAYQMWEMQRCMPHAVHFCDHWSAHFTLLEHPEFVLRHLNDALLRWGYLNKECPVQHDKISEGCTEMHDQDPNQGVRDVEPLPSEMPRGIHVDRVSKLESVPVQSGFDVPSGRCVLKRARTNQRVSPAHT